MVMLLCIIGKHSGDIMRYWINQLGECGTMDDDGFVPGSADISKEAYDEYVASLPGESHKYKDEKKIQDKERNILRRLAIDELILEGYEFYEQK